MGCYPTRYRVGETSLGTSLAICTPQAQCISITSRALTAISYSSKITRWVLSINFASAFHCNLYHFKQFWQYWNLNKASCLLGRCSLTWVTPLGIFCFSYFSGSHFFLTLAKTTSCIAGTSKVHHHTQSVCWESVWPTFLSRLPSNWDPPIGISLGTCII
jgi:hypothetical protein